MDYETLRDPDGMWMRLAAHPALGLTDEALAGRPWALTPEQFRLRYAPEIAPVQRTANLLPHSSREEFDLGLESVIEDQTPPLPGMRRSGSGV